MSQVLSKIGLRQATEADSAFVYEAKRAALGDYVSQTWGWEEAFQQRYHREHYDPSVTSVITLGEQDIGCMVVCDTPEYRMLESIYLLPEFQKRGIGGALVGRVLEEAARDGVAVRLHVLKINPAVRLYKRLKFRIIGETENHYVMGWGEER